MPAPEIRRTVDRLDQRIAAFMRRWGTAARYEYVTGVAGDYLDPQWTGLRQRVSGNITFWPTEVSRLRLQYNYDDTTAIAVGTPRGFHAVILALEVAVGAHGAHTF